MEYIFKCSGHQNVLATHPRTLEFTKDKDLGIDNTSIIGVNANFDYSSLTEFLSYKTIKVILICGDYEDSFIAKINPFFISKRSIIFRKSDFESDKTLGISATKGANEINKHLIQALRSDNTKMHVIFRKVD